VLGKGRKERILPVGRSVLTTMADYFDGPGELAARNAAQPRRGRRGFSTSGGACPTREPG
jgi:site-specific recombinase XerC